MTCNSKRTVPLRHAIIAVQLISFAISICFHHIPQPLSIITYCLAVFTSPFLMLSYGYGYLSSTKKWSWDCIPFAAEIAFSILYVGAMIYGIRFHAANSALFSGLLAAYLADALLCVLGYFEYCFNICRI